MPYPAPTGAEVTTIDATRVFYEALARSCDSDVAQIELALVGLVGLELDQATLDGFQAAQEDAQRAAARCRRVIAVLNARHHQLEEAIRATPAAARIEFYEDDTAGGRGVARLVPTGVRLALAGWRERVADARSAPPWTPRTGSWTLTDSRDPAGVPGGSRGVPGPWWQHGRPMHGVYHRAAADPQLRDQADGMAVLNGWRGSAWRGPASMARWRSPLVSYWNPILAQGSGRLGVVEWIDHDQYTADAVLGGFKPYGYLQCTLSQAEQLNERAAAAPFGVAVSAYDPDPQVEDTGWVTVARTDTLGELFPNLGGLVDAYRDVLPDEVFEREVLPLQAAAGVRPVDFLDDFLALENGPDPLLGLVLGYPPLVTAGAMLRKVPGWWVECGSLPPRHWPADAPLTGGTADPAGESTGPGPTA